MKKNIFYILFCICFISCSNLINGIDQGKNFSYTDSAGQNEEVVVNGTLNINGAFPEQIIKAVNNSKSSIPDFDDALQYFSINATLLDNQNNPTEIVKIFEFDSNYSSFSLILNYGTWKIEAYGKDNNFHDIFYGVLGTKDNPENLILEKNQTLPTLNIILYPICDEEITGTVELNISFEDVGIKSAIVKWQENGEEKKQSFQSASQTEDLSGIKITLKDDFDTSPETVPPKKPDSYRIEIIFFDDYDYKNPVFSHHDVVNVFSNLKTNVWHNNGCSYINNESFNLIPTVLSKRHYFYVNQNNGNYENEGSSYSPLDSVQTAVDRIISMNDGNEYTIFLTDDYTATGSERYADDGSTPAIVAIHNESGIKPLNLKIKSFNNSYKLDANTEARVIFVQGGVSSKVTLTLENIEITKGLCEGHGGGLLIHDYVDLNIRSNVKIDNNKTTSTADNKGGAGLYFYQSSSGIGNELSISGTNIEISNNTSGSYGGGIYINGSTKAEISSGVKISENSANYGGGIAFTGNNSDVIISGTSEITQNIATSSGGGLYFDGSTIAHLKESVVISDNTSESFGGGISLGKESESSSLEVYLEDNCVVKKNTTATLGAGVFVINGKFIMNGGVIGADTLSDGNECTDTVNGSGGGIFIAKNFSNVEINDGKIINNTAQVGHCIYSMFGKCDMKGGFVDRNTPEAETNKILIYVTSQSGLDFTKNYFSMQGDAHCGLSNVILLNDCALTVSGDLTQQKENGVNIPSAVILVDSTRIGKYVLRNNSGENFVSSNYEKFQTFENEYLIDVNGHLKERYISVSSLSSAPNPTEPTIYTIKQADDLRSLSEWSSTSSGSNFQNCTFLMVNDIDLNLTPFTPIATKKPFAGTFDGNGYKISGLYINSADNKQALFSQLGIGTIKNLVVDGIVTGGQYCAGIAAYFANGSGCVDNCISHVKVKGTDWVGGITGELRVGEIKNCTNVGQVIATGTNGNAGGIAGYLDPNCSIKNCSNFGDITSTKYAGGIIGCGGTKCTVNNCYNFAKTSVTDVNTYTVGLISGNSTSDSNYDSIYYISIPGDSTAPYGDNNLGEYTATNISNDSSGIETLKSSLNYWVSSKEDYNTWNRELTINGVKYPISSIVNDNISLTIAR
ncbi:MAG: hypothetical protein KBT21_10335 [Treponema sp.]|nr:hypothetical protein [Candidatus Treponema merdequi]